MFLHIDMDSFFASAEVIRHPELQGKPLVIGAPPKEGKGRGVVSTCSYEARKFGIHSAMPVSRAWVLCPHAIFLPPDTKYYQVVSQRIMKILISFGYPFSQVSIDEAYIDVSTLENYESAQNLAGEIKLSILNSEGLTCSIGIGPSMVTAKIASDLNKPDGLVIIRPETIIPILSPLPVRTVPGIGKKTCVILDGMGIKTIGDLMNTDVQKLTEKFGRFGARMSELSQGIDREAIRENESFRSVSREYTFEEDTNDKTLVINTLEILINELHNVIIAEKILFKTVTVKIRYTGFKTYTRSVTLNHPSQAIICIKENADKILADFIKKDKIRLVGIKLSNLLPATTRQTVLADFIF